MIKCIQVHDVKDHIHNLVVSDSVACFIPHGAGIRVTHQIPPLFLVKAIKFYFFPLYSEEA